MYTFFAPIFHIVAINGGAQWIKINLSAICWLRLTYLYSMESGARLKNCAAPFKCALAAFCGLSAYT